jgi:hypothetical protein
MRDVDLDRVPGILVLKNRDRVTVSWESGDLALESHLIFSPAEGLARSVNDPKYVYPMRRFSEGASERVRFGFRSDSCSAPREFGICHSRNDNLFLAAELPCHPEQESRFSR